MRPLKLVMNAFGPYKGKVEIDFTQLSQSSLFLVSGPTGAGKTTIFDAIAYALFDQASGDTRQKDTFKSQFAKDTDLSYVELEFELGENRYFIRREPTQIGPGTRSKTKQIQSNVAFHKGNQVTTKVKEANDEIQHIIGLTYDQFRQIVMLPQGSFKKMLESDSGDKEKIFRNIFQTKQIEQFQDRLKAKAKVLSDQYKSNEQAMKQAFSTIEIEENETWTKAIEQFDIKRILEILRETIVEESDELNSAKETIFTFQQALKEQEQILSWLEQKEKNLAEQTILNLKRQSIEQKEVALKQHIEAIKVANAKATLEESLTQLKKQEVRLAELKEQQETLKKQETEQSVKLEAVKVDFDNLKNIREAISKLNEALTIIDQIDEKDQLIEQQNKTIDKNQQTIEELKKQFIKVTKSIEKSEATLDSIEQLRTKIGELKEVMVVSKETLTKLSHRKEQLEQVCTLQQKEQEAIVQCEAAKEKKEQVYLKLVKGKAEYYTNLASTLAEGLVEGEDCPVCGSVHHPNKATTSASTSTKEQVEALELEEKQANTAFVQIETKLDNIQADIISRCEELEIEQSQTKTEYEKAKVDEQNINETVNGFAIELETAEQEVSEEAEMKEQLEALRKQAQSLQTEQQQCQSTIEFTKTRLQEIIEEKERLKDKLSSESKEELKQAVREKEQLIEKTEKEYEQLQNQTHELRSELASTKTAIELTESQLKEIVLRKEKLEKDFEQIKEVSSLGDKFADYVLEESQQVSWSEEVETYKQSVLVNQDRINQLDEHLNQLESLEEKTVYEEAIVDIKTKIQELDQKRDILLTTTSQNQRAEETIKGYYNQSSEVEKEYQLYGMLSDMANGAKQTDYISFERYVLGIYFEEILIAANQRFSQMTNNRYELQRQTEKGKGSGKQGLDMEVFDHYTGKTRSVHTLSGGETFKASLALALGLSDVIQNQNGGVSVDTLFVDEGFGTLDSDSLDMAVQTLLDLHQKGRLIGIISHVDELKTRIPAHIVVEKTATGSTAHIKN
ncbi:AAA family ATPase [Marinilactibacillus sp. Marseille-P9653]|uniref:AAA family ATPase n=1 Tax=Marinilactibacillus sp. Marseille-P9653 TaxID=2866583 RepID=UPI001CE3FAC0|nr:SMC family ATPase [Marinilactibacillus sp. Marseille-P9653]